MIHSNKTRYEAICAVRQGSSLRKAAAMTGASQESVRRWCVIEGITFARGPLGGASNVRTSHTKSGEKPCRIGLAQRLAIASGLAAKRTHKEIALGIGFDRSSVSREISLHCLSDGTYDPYQAQLISERSARRPKVRKTDTNRKLRDYVLNKLYLRWSPRQISWQLRLDFPDDEEMRLSHEAIYQALYVQGKGALRQELKLEKALRSGRTSRLPQSKLTASRGKNKSWVEGCEISLRPAEANDRAVPGHWEGDLVIGGDGKSCLITLVERTTRFLLVRKLDLHTTNVVTSELADMIQELPYALKRSITWDQGMEMAGHIAFTDKTGVRVYFCDPHSPWQRGTNENTNGLIRDYYPKGTDFTDISDEDIREMQDQLNGRPRETLGWKKPADALTELLMKAA